MTYLLPSVALSSRDAIHHTDLLSQCRALGDASVDMILCDLPYGTTDCSWDTVIPLAPMWAEFKRVIKPRGAIVLTASQPFTSALVMGNIEMFKYCFVWSKNKVTGFMHARNKPLKKHEDVLVFSKGTTNHESLSNSRMAYYPQFSEGERWKKKHVTPNAKRGTLHRATKSNLDYVGTTATNDKRYPTSILSFPKSNNDSLHVSQKPVALFEYLIRTYTQPGDVVLDPCLGSGTTAVACRNLDRHYIGCDSSAESVAIARKRLQDTDPFQPSTLSTGAIQHSLFEVAS